MEPIPQIIPEAPKATGGVSDSGSILIPRIGATGGETATNRKRKLRMPKFRKSNFFKNRKHKKAFLVAMTVFALIGVLSGVLLYGVYVDAMNAKASLEKLMVSSQSQDLNLLKTELQNTKSSFEELDKSYSRVSWMSVFPFAGKYVNDGRHAIKAAEYGFDTADVVLQTVEPYSDLLGFNGGQEATSGEKTAQERLDFVVATLPDVIPQVDKIKESMLLVQKELSYIDPADYPEEFRGILVRSKLEEGLRMVDLSVQFVDEGKPLIESAPFLLGSDSPRTYMILFQNDKELRPTGGFITAYSIAKVEKGKFEPILSSDIYDLDDNYTPSIVAPQPIIKYLKGPYTISNKLRLRDINWDPDFENSMKLFVEEAEKAGIEDIDGVIAVDTQLLVNILDVIGPIGVPGFGNFSTEIVSECNCPQVIYELESFADVEGPIVWSENEPGKIVFAPENYDDRKKIIGPLMNSILSNMLGQTKEKIPALFGAVMDSIYENHVLVYFLDDKAQSGARGFGIAGKIKAYDGDYLYINDSNLGGRKSNLYVKQQIEQELEISKNGNTRKTLTITYNNPEKFDGWLNSILPNWVRIYVPEGSVLVDAQGLQDMPEPYVENGKTVFAGFFELRPEGIAKVILTYEIPFEIGKQYNFYIQKQPGKDAPTYVTRIGKREYEEIVRTDSEFVYSY